MIPGHPAVGSRDGPWGTCPHPERGQSAAAPRRGLATHWRRLRYWRRHKRQRQAGGGAAGCEQGGGLIQSRINRLQNFDLTASILPSATTTSCFDRRKVVTNLAKGSNASIPKYFFMKSFCILLASADPPGGARSPSSSPPVAAAPASAEPLGGARSPSSSPPVAAAPVSAEPPGGARSPSSSGQQLWQNSAQAAPLGPGEY